jgi:hypothetical protein
MRIALVVLLGLGACGPADKGADGAQGDPGPAGVDPNAAIANVSSAVLTVTTLRM